VSLALVWLAPALAWLAASLAWGQARVFVGPGMPQVIGGVPQGAGQDPTGVVYVRDSAMAMEKLALARRMERLHEWGKSADVYQEILEKYSDRVVPAHEDPQSHVVDQYASVTETVRQSLCKWPEDGLTVYRSRYETPAAAILNAAGNDGLDKLHEVLWRYFPTDSAKEAAIRLMDAYFEEGDYAAVSQIGMQLLDWHPNLLAQRPMVLYRTALAARLAGQADDCNRCLDELQRQFPQSMGVIRGQEVVLTASLSKELSRSGIVHGPSSDSWPTVGGDESRSKVCSSTVKPGARLYAIRIDPFKWNQIPNSPDNQQKEHNDDDLRAKGVGLGIMPAVDKGQLFFQDNTRIYARDLDGGEPLPAWVDTYPMENGAYKVPGNPSPVPLGRQLCVTVNDKYVAAVTGFPDPWTDSAPPGEDSRLVCLDRKTGRQIWTSTLHDLPNSQTALRALQMGGSPLFVGDNLYVLVHGIKGQFEDCYVACFALATGQFRWATFIANSGIEPSFGPMADEASQFSDAVSHIAYAGGRIFVVTNLGAVASVDAFTGAIAWLDIYRTETTPMAGVNFNPALLRRFGGIAQPDEESVYASAPWIYNPAVVQEGNLFVLPADSHSLFVYDAAGGKLIKQIPLSELQETRDPNVQNSPDLPSTLLGVRGNLVYLAGARQVWQVPWHDSKGPGQRRFDARLLAFDRGGSISIQAGPGGPGPVDPGARPGLRHGGCGVSSDAEVSASHPGFLRAARFGEQFVSQGRMGGRQGRPRQRHRDAGPPDRGGRSSGRGLHGPGAGARQAGSGDRRCAGRPGRAAALCGGDVRGGGAGRRPEPDGGGVSVVGGRAIAAGRAEPGPRFQRCVELRKAVVAKGNPGAADRAVFRPGPGGGEFSGPAGQLSPGPRRLRLVAAESRRRGGDRALSGNPRRSGLPRGSDARSANRRQHVGGDGGGEGDPGDSGNAGWPRGV